MPLIYGLYHINYSDVESVMKMARSYGITKFDTAGIYGNEGQTLENKLPGDFITTKIYKVDIRRIMNRYSRKYAGSQLFDSILLHRPMANECWKALVETSQKYKEIGISNYDMNGLKELLKYCEDNSLPIPAIHQMEVHPFIDCVPLIKFCQENKISVQGHTVLTQGQFLNYPLLLQMAAKYEASTAQVLIAWARSKNIDICINSSSPDHLSELTRFIELKSEDIAEIDTWHRKAPHRFYAKINRVPDSLIGITNKEEYLNNIVNQLYKDISSEYPSGICENLPLQGEGYRFTGKEIAIRLYPEISEGTALNKYRLFVKSLRRKRSENRKVELMRKKGHTCCIIRRTSGPYSEIIANPKPMPVDITNPEEFTPLFDYLVSSETPPQGDTIFPKGTIFPDGRMDLCKQVVGPSSIGRLCETVKKSKIVRHFLLGNNVALQDMEARGAESMASVMRDNSIHIETWYLAGNCIGPTGTRIMADALSTNRRCKALWLKRNPVGPQGALYLNSMLRINETLVLLDLHNCALGDVGVANLLSNPEEFRALKHLYLDANGIESTTAIANWCRVGTPVTLYASINRLGDKAIIELAEALQGNKWLKRLCLGSTHMHNEGLKAVISMALTCPNLKCLNVGCYKSSADMGEHPGNFFDDDAVPNLVELVTKSSSLQYLSIAGSKISEEGIKKIPLVPHISMDLGKGPWHHIHKPNDLRFAKHPKRVVHIDSIYRGKM